MSAAGLLVVLFLLAFFGAGFLYVWRDVTELVCEQRKLDELWDDSDESGDSLLSKDAA